MSKGVKDVLNSIKHFKRKQLWSLFVFSVKYPLFIYPTLLATSKVFSNAKKEFPKTQHKNGKANAYRHALWSASICYTCLKWSANKYRIIRWTIRITNKHEELFPNTILAKKMDIHNNRIGVRLFIKNDFKSVEEIQEIVKNKLHTAKKIINSNNSDLYPNDLVYFEEYDV